MLRQIFDSCNIYYQPNIITSNPQAQEGDGKLDDTVDIEDHDTTDGDEDETDDDDDNDAGVVFVDRDKVRKDLLPLFAACAEEWNRRIAFILHRIKTENILKTE